MLHAFGHFDVLARLASIAHRSVSNALTLLQRCKQETAFVDFCSFANFLFIRLFGQRRIRLHSDRGRILLRFTSALEFALDTT